MGSNGRVDNKEHSCSSTLLCSDWGGSCGAKPRKSLKSWMTAITSAGHTGASYEPFWGQRKRYESGYGFSDIAEKSHHRNSPYFSKF